jgi:hypothetical protein
MGRKWIYTCLRGRWKKEKGGDFLVSCKANGNYHGRSPGGDLTARRLEDVGGLRHLVYVLLRKRKVSGKTRMSESIEPRSCSKRSILL